MKTTIGLNLRGVLLTAAFLVALGGATHASARSYLIDLNSRTATDLGTLGGDYSYASAINDSGQVVGYSYTADASYHAFITGPNGVGMTDLGTLGGPVSFGYGINDAGQVVGISSTAEGVGHAFITGPNGTGMRDLGAPGSDISEAYGINDTGQVAVVSDLGGERAFITGSDGMGMRNLGTLPGGNYSWPTAINNAGQVVGFSDRMNNAEDIHAFITGPDGMGMRDLGALGGSYSRAWGINDAGQVAGSSGEHAFITGPDGTGMTDLNSLVDLPAGVVLTGASGINNAGQVIASGNDPIPAIPEPESYALLLAGLALIAVVARRKKDIYVLAARGVADANSSGSQEKNIKL